MAFSIQFCKCRKRKKSEIPQRCACGISVPSRGVLARQGDGSFGRRPLVCFRFRPLTKASFRRARNQKQPVAFATSCRSIFLRRERDSNSRYPFGVHTLSRRASSATRASLQYVSREIGTAKVIIFSGSASVGGSIFPRGTIKSGYGRCNRGIPRGSG